ncbi:hypothetical protein [Zavarzinia sp.]|uniref:hypothetical protein n=1 Tax=Zavarzinia sp. TaxID=2027920 RepID=UPI003562A5D1
MNLQEYQTLAMRTMNPSPIVPSIVVAALGLAGEAAELHEAVDDRDLAQVRKEAGDLAWYMALALREISMPWPGPAESESGLDDGAADRARNVGQFDAMRLHFARSLMISAGEICEVVKKHVAQGHPLDRGVLCNRLTDLLHDWMTVLGQHDIAPSACLEANVAKLAARYPEGFAADRSVGREG